MTDRAGLHDEPVAFDVLSTERVFHSGRVIDVRTDKVALPGGSAATRDVVVHPGAVGIIALDDEDRVLLVQQYRHPVRRLLWEPPAGLLDSPGEHPLDTAKRELFEEAHHRAGRWNVLLDVFTSPGMADEAVRIYLARDVRPADGPRYAGVEEELDMPVAWVTIDDAIAAMLAGRLHNPLAVMGILATARARADGFSALRPGDAPWPERG